jgi:hypothetical protein
MRLDSEETRTSLSVLTPDSSKISDLPLIHEMNPKATSEITTSKAKTDTTGVEQPIQEILFSPAFTHHGHTLGKRKERRMSDIF